MTQFLNHSLNRVSDDGASLNSLRGDCPADEVLAGYLGGGLDAAGRNVVEQHVERCDDCCAVVSQAAQTSLATPAAPCGDVPDLRAGQDVGRYVILHEIGRGGMGVVYAAYDAELDRKVALKVVTRSAGGSCRLSEARAMAKLSHANVVPVFDVMTHGALDVIAMEFVNGRNLRQWLREASRTCAAINAAMLSAARGLAAVHDAGLVHCDFKPENILVGADDRARVADFGLALVASPQVIGAGGTPAYTAPEVRRGGARSAASDQYALCVTWSEALTGQRVDAASIEHSLSATPPRLGRVLKRGLAEEPAGRFATIEDLLRAAERAMTPRRGLYGVGLLAIALAALAMVIIFWPRPGGTESLSATCDARAGELSNAWIPSRRSQLESAYDNIDGRLVATSLARTATAVEQYGARWRGAYAASCRRSGSAGPSDTPENRCLDHRLAALDGVTKALLNEPSARVLSRAPRVLAGLPSIEQCSGAGIRAETTLPQDRELAGRVAELTRSLFEIAPLLNAGQPKRASAALAAMDTALEATAFDPLLAHYHELLGKLADATGRYDEAGRQLEVASRQAASAGDDGRQAEILTQLMAVEGYRKGNLEAGMVWARAAKLAIIRAGNPPRTLRHYHHALGWVLFTAGRYGDARVEFETAVHAARAEDTDVASTLDAIGTSYYREQRYDDAERYHRKAIVMLEEKFGPYHLRLASPLNNLGLVVSHRGGDLGHGREDAAALYRRAMSVLVDSVGEETPGVAMILANIGAIRLEQGKLDEAATAFERAQEILTAALGAEHPSLAENIANLARVAAEQGHLTLAIERMGRAIVLRSKLGATHPQLGDDFINLGDLHCLNKNPAAAIAAYGRADAVFRANGQREGDEGIDAVAAQIAACKASAP